MPCDLYAADTDGPVAVPENAGGTDVLGPVHETSGMASFRMSCSSGAGRQYSKHPAAADLHPKSHITTADIRCPWVNVST